MKTKELIDSLSGQLAPVRPRSLATRAGTVLVIGAAYLAFLLLLFHHRPDLMQALGRGEFLALQVLLFLLAALSLVSFARVLVPGSRVPAAQSLALAFLGLAALALVLFRYLAPLPETFAAVATVSAAHCASTVFLAAAVLGAAFFWIARREAPTAPFGLGTLAAVASVALSSIAVDLSCPNENPLHILFFHLLVPLLALLAAALPLARRLLRW
jgi:hypothetical protein